MKDINKVIWHKLEKDPPKEEGSYLICEKDEDGSEYMAFAEWRKAFSPICICGKERTGNGAVDFANSLKYELRVPEDGFYEVSGAFVSDADYSFYRLKQVTHWAYKPEGPT